MKKLFVIFIVLISFFVSSNYFAQGKIMQGMYKLGGSITFSTGSSETDLYDESSMRFSFSPSLAYLITDNLEVGGTIGFIYYENKEDVKATNYYDAHTYKYYGRNYSIGPAIRYYFDAGKFFPFVELGFIYSTNKLSGDNKSESRIFNATIGSEIFLSSSVAVEPFLKYNIKNYGSGDYTTIGVGVGINYFIVE